MRIHILGICGTFMGGVALLAKRAGIEVTGSDQNTYPPMSTLLESEGIRLYEGYDPEQLQPRPDLVVIGRSILVGKPMAQLLLKESCTVTIAHSRTRDLPEVVRRADIVVAAVGRAKMVRGDWIKPGATVIDVGINRLPPEPGKEKGKLVGDVDYDEAMAVAAAVTPVPGGVGPMTIAVLLRNTIVAAHRNDGLVLPEDAI